MSDYVIAWSIALAITLAAETPVYVALIGGDRRRAALIGVSASLLTHPVLWFVVMKSVPWTVANWAISELTIAVVEGAWVWVWWGDDRRWLKALGIALAANLCSIVCGELLRPLLPYL